MLPQAASKQARKSLKCPTCAREFSRSEHLARHVRSHNKEKPFRCAGCGRNYSRLDVLARHQRNAEHCRSTPSMDGTQPPVARSAMNVHFSDNDERIALDASGLDSGEPVQNALGNVEAANPTLLVADRLYQKGVGDYGARSAPGGRQDAHSQHFTEPPNLWMAQNDLLVPSTIDMSDLFPPWTVDEGIHACLFDPLASEVPIVSDTNGVALGAESLRTSKVKEIWFTRDTAAPTTSGTENTSACTSRMASPRLGTTEVDNQHRSGLQTRLQIQSFETSVPSTAFLNTCIRLYFTKAHSIYPIIHPATFRPSKSNSALTLAICAMGTLFMGSDRAVDIGIHLFNRLNKATLLYWEKAKMKNSNELISIIQGAAIGQAFGLLSGNSHALLTVDAFHGPPVSWARQQGLFHVQNNVDIPADISDADLEQKWREWSRNEEHVRTTHALRVIDAELASLLHHEPIMKLNCRALFPTCSNKLFVARTPKEWISRYMAERGQWEAWQRDQSIMNSIYSLKISNLPAFSTLTAYVVLEELHMCAISARSQEFALPAIMEVVHTQLFSFHHKFIVPEERDGPDTHKLCVLWHSVYLSMYADIDLLEKLIGREGTDNVSDQDMELMRWAEAYNCPRAVAHALMIKKHVESMTFLDEPPIHLPRSMFHAGIVLFCYYKFAAQRWDDRIPRINERYPELELCGGSVESVLREGRELAQGMPTFQRALYGIVQLLQRVGSSGLSRQFANILGTITVGELGQE